MIERSDDDGVAVLTLAHGPVGAMDLELCEAVAAHFRALADDPARAVVLTGSGRAFSAGVDLRRYLDGGEPYVRRFLPALSEAFLAAFELPKPLVAAVNGHAIAGGCVLAATADLLLMAEGAGRIGVPEIKVGVPFPPVPLEIVRYAVGEVAARRLVVGAATHPPAEAAAIGLVHEVVPPGELLPRAVAAARAMATDVPPDTFAVTKAQLRRETRERIARRADEEETATRLWIRRAGDGWTAEYLAAATRR
ncbi:MAG TPA: enoyl-CoA hydratase/isomerase family protein [Pseudonocardia sp.]|nr:enoyl-CoA hydratase/isomerase family protein [Pseudonocardia sp.]